jgi:hypothetical protein
VGDAISEQFLAVFETTEIIQPLKAGENGLECCVYLEGTGNGLGGL